MKCAALIAAVLLVLPLSAQTFTQQVQQHRSGQGTVTIHHDADIDRLVNGSAAGTQTATASKPAATATTSKTATTTNASKTKTEKSKAETSKTEKSKAEKSKTEKPKAKPQSDTTKTKSQSQSDTARHQSSAPTEPGGSAQGSDPVSSLPDSTALPSAPRHGYKTTGYRVQAFAGGNTRTDRQRAERTGNAMRQLLPGEDVYVRFYSPRWVCRVGNYRTYEEAHEKMLLIRKLGYESATIVKGKIIVYYD